MGHKTDKRRIEENMETKRNVLLRVGRDLACRLTAFKGKTVSEIEFSLLPQSLCASSIALLLHKLCKDFSASVNLHTIASAIQLLEEFLWSLDLECNSDNYATLLLFAIKFSAQREKKTDLLLDSYFPPAYSEQWNFFVKAV